MPKGERFFVRFSKKIKDGTRCDEESMDACVDGKCEVRAARCIRMILMLCDSFVDATVSSQHAS